MSLGMSSELMHFAVIGNPVDHSLSPIIHQCFAEETNLTLTYEKILGDNPGFEAQISDFFLQGGKGLNVTLPFKQQAFAMAQKSSERCRKAGAANTLWMQDQVLWADNTDGAGLTRDLKRYIELPEKNILLLGSGGAARGIIYPLLEHGPAKIVLAARNLEKTAELQADFPQISCIELNRVNGQYDLIINATSASLDGQSVTLPADCMKHKPLCYDLAYKRTGMTPFVEYARTMGCEAYDGLGMLVEQAAESFRIWTNILPPLRNSRIWRILREQ